MDDSGGILTSPVGCFDLLQRATLVPVKGQTSQELEAGGRRPVHAIREIDADVESGRRQQPRQLSARLGLGAGCTWPKETDPCTKRGRVAMVETSLWPDLLRRRWRR